MPTLTHLGHSVVEVVHVISQESAEPRQDLPVPRVVLQGHLLLHFAIVYLHRAKGLQGVSGVNGLTRFPAREIHSINGVNGL